MPWCDDCDRFLNPNTVSDDGTCPQCGASVISPRRLERARKGRGSSADAMAVRSERSAEVRASSSDAATASDDETPTTPWHFWVLLAALIIYLAWRLVQGILWLADKL